MTKQLPAANSDATSWFVFLFVLRRRFPDGRKQRQGLRFRLLQLGPVEGEEIVHAEVRFRHFREELLVVGQSVMFAAVAIVAQHVLPAATLFVSFEHFSDTRFVE